MNISSKFKEIFFTRANASANPKATIRSPEDYRQLVDQVIECVTELITADTSPHTGSRNQKILEDFETLRTHLFGPENFYGSHKPFMDTVVKGLLDQLLVLLRDNEISQTKRVEEILKMSSDLMTCSGGAAYALQNAVSNLDNYRRGLEGELFEKKALLTDPTILRYMQRQGVYDKGMEKHRCAVYYEKLASYFGLPSRDDPFLPAEARFVEEHQLLECKLEVGAELTPPKLIMILAKEIYDSIVACYDGDQNSIIEVDNLSQFYQKYEAVRTHIENRYGPIDPTSFIRDIDDSFPPKYKFVGKPTLIAKQLYEHLSNPKQVELRGHGSNLVDLGSTVSLGNHPEGGTIQMLDNLFWCVNGNDCTVVYAAELLTISPSQIVANLRSQGADADDCCVALQSIAQFVVDEHQKENITSIPTEWFLAMIEQGQGRDQNISDSYWKPIVKLAVTMGDPRSLRALAAAGVVLNLVDLDGTTSLMLAARRGNIEVLNILLGATNCNKRATNNQKYTAALHAAYAGHIDVLRILLEDGTIDVNEKYEPNDDSLLTFAAAQGHADVLAFLIEEKGANIEISNALGYTAVVRATFGGHAKAVDVLARNRARLDMRIGASKASLLIIAAGYGHLDVVKALIGYGADIHAVDQNRMTAAVFAVQKGHKDVLIALIDKTLPGNSHLDINRSFEFETGNGRESYTLLLEAAIRGHTEIVELLLKNGADSCAESLNGDTAATFAAEAGHVEILRLLFDDALVGNKKIDINRPYWKVEISLLMIAVAHGHAQVVEFLIQNKAQIHYKNGKGHTAAVIATYRGRQDILAMLTDKKNQPGEDFDFNERYCKEKLDLVMIAASQGHADILKFFLAFGEGRVNLKNKDNLGRDAVYLAANYGEVEALAVLLESMNETDIKEVVNRQEEVSGDSLLIMASGKGHTNVVKLLLEKGADICHKNKRNFNAAAVAVLENKIDVVRFILDGKFPENFIQSPCGPTNDTLASFAACANHSEILDLLIERGADVINTKNDLGLTIAARAIQGGHVESMRVLLKRGVDINAPCAPGGHTPAMVAAGRKETSVAFFEFLISNGAKLDLVNDRKENPAMLALANNRLDILEVVRRHCVTNLVVHGFLFDPLAYLAVWRLDIGALKYLIDKAKGARLSGLYSAVGQAVIQDKIQILIGLIDNGMIDINAVFTGGNTLLMLAVSNNRPGIVDLLLAKGARQDQKNSLGDTAAEIANRLGFTPILEILSNKRQRLS